MQFPNLQIRSRYRKFREPTHSTRSEVFDEFVSSFFVFLSIVTLHTIAMMIFEQLSFKDSLWLTMTNITTVGYGDLSAKTDLGRISTILLIYIGGIALLAKMVAEYIDYRMEKRERKIRGHWEWKTMKDHLLIINTPEQDTERYLKRLIEQIKLTPSLASMPIQILSDHFPDGLPLEIRESGVVHVHGRAESEQTLEKLNIKHARYIIIIARDYSNPASDSITFDILDRIEEQKSTVYILAEVVEDSNRKRFRENGADAVVRPVRAYPEIMTRALEAPGTEQILENLFSHKGDYPQRFEVIIRNMKWAQIATRIINAGIGIPLGYIDEQKIVHTNPNADKQIHTDYLIVLVNEESKATKIDIANALHG